VHGAQLLPSRAQRRNALLAFLTRPIVWGRFFGAQVLIVLYHLVFCVVVQLCYSSDRMVKQAKVKKGADNLGSRLQLVMKSGE
jgi:hypothetical protein